MSITLKIIDQQGDVREVVVNEGETIELQSGEKIDVTSVDGNALELTLVGNGLIVGDGVIEILVTNFTGSGGLVADGKVLSARQVAAGEFNRVEIAETIVEAEGTEVEVIDLPDQQSFDEQPDESEFYDPLAEVDGLGANGASTDSILEIEEDSENRLSNSGQVLEDPVQQGGPADEVVIEVLEPVNVLEDDLLSSSSLSWLKEGMEEDASLQEISLDFYYESIQGELVDDVYSFNIGELGFLNFHSDGSVQWLPSDIIQTIGIPESTVVTLIAEYKVLNNDESHQLNLTLAKEGETLVITEVDSLPAKISGEIIESPEGGLSTDSWIFSHDGGYLGLDVNSIYTDIGYGYGTILNADLALFKFSNGSWEEIASADYGEGWWSSKGFDGSENNSEAYLQILDLESGDYKVDIRSDSDVDTKGKYELTLHGDVNNIFLDGLPNDGANPGSVTEDIVYLGQETAVESYSLGQWKAEGSTANAKLMSVTMSYNGQEFTQMAGDIQEGSFYRFVIFDPETEVKLGEILLHQNGQIDLQPTDAVIELNADQSFSADYSYLVEDSGNIGIYSQTISLQGQNDAPVVSFSRSEVNIEDSDNGSMVTKAVVNLVKGDYVDTFAVNLFQEGDDNPDVTLGIDINDQGYISGTAIKATLKDNQLILEGSATASEYESVIEKIYYIKEGEEYYQYLLEVVVTDDKNQESELTTRYINTERSHDIRADEDTLANLLTDEDETNSYSLRDWKPSPDSNAELFSIVMHFNGKDYVYDSVDFTSNEFFKIILQDPEGEPAIPIIGEALFYSDGRVEFVPTESINQLSEGEVLDTRFTMSYAGASQIFVQTIDFEITGKNDAPMVTLRMDDNTTEGIQTGLFGKVDFSDPDDIEVDFQSIKSMKVWAPTNPFEDQLSVDLTADTGKDNNLNFNYSFENGILTITGEGSLEDYEAALSRVYLIPGKHFYSEDLISGDRYLKVELTDIHNATSTSDPTLVTINVSGKQTIEAEEVDIRPFIGEDSQSAAMPQDTFNVGTWKAPEADGTITSLVMRFSGAELVRDIQDYSENEGFKITISNEANGISDIGTLYFKPSGTIEFEPTEAVNIIPEGILMTSEFTYTVDSGSATTVHTIEMILNGSDSDYDVLFLDSGQLGINLSDIANTSVQNVEEIALKNQMLSFNVEDVISITDDNNTLLITEAESGSYVFDDANWVKTQKPVTINGTEYAHWSAAGDTHVTIYIDNNLDIAGP